MAVDGMLVVKNMDMFKLEEQDAGDEDEARLRT